MIFYLGTHEPSWLVRCTVPLMVSRNRLARLKTLPTAATDWVMDSGGFTELQQHGRWRIDARTYATELEHVRHQVGRLVWAAPQDWMCEPAVIHGGTFKGVRFAGTGLNVREHQARTVGNYLDLRALNAPVIPVLQGYSLADYERCADAYEAAGVRLADLPTVGLGSVCRRENTNEIGEVVAAMSARGIRCHGFGCKGGAVRRYGDMLASADSMAWSLAGRRRGSCTHLKSRCANHMHYAMAWRESVVSAPKGGTAQTWEGARTDLGGGQVVGDVPLALWQEYSAALATMSRTRQALSDALGLHPKEMMLAKVCDEYEGACHIIGTWRGWTDCEACGWPREDHEDHS